MPARIFVNYRRDDDPNGAARVRDGLVVKFGRSSVFMDVDNLLAGQRFDEELAKALAQCDVLVAVIGPRWMEALQARRANGERDYVREEIAEALRRRIVVIPALVGRDRQMPPLPRPDDLPENIRDLALYQKHDIAYERFGRDIAELIEAITTVRRNNRPQFQSPRVPWGWVGATAMSVFAISYVGAYYSGVPVPWPTAPPNASPPQGLPPSANVNEAERLPIATIRAEEERKQSEAQTAKQRADADARRKADEDARKKAAAEAETNRKAEEAERQRVAAAKAEAENHRVAAAKAEAERQRAKAQAEREAKLIADAEQRIRDEIDARRASEVAAVAKQKADEDARKKAVAEAETKRKAEEAERQRVAAAKAETDRQRAEAQAEAKRKLEDEARAKAEAIVEAKRVADAAARKAEADAARRDPALTIKPGSGQSFRDCPKCPEMVVVPAGEFLMGSTPAEIDAVIKGSPEVAAWVKQEGPRHKVSFAQAFSVGRTHIARGEFAAFVTATGHKTDGGCHSFGGNGWKLDAGRSWRSPGFAQTDSHPVVCVNWQDAQAYAAWISQSTGRSYRLLSEAEAEYVTRATTQATSQPRFFFGNDYKDLCAHGNGVDRAGAAKFNWPPKSGAPCDDGYAYTAPVASYKANAWGLHDVHGNAFSWTADCFADSYVGAPSDGTARTTGACGSRVIRGGSWSNVPLHLRAARRLDAQPGSRSDNLGFRVARTLSASP